MFPPSLIQVEPLNFPNLKASILELHFLHSLQGFWHILFKIWSGALLSQYQGLSWIKREVALETSKSRLVPARAWSKSNAFWFIHMWIMIQVIPMFRIEDCSRSKLGPGRWSSWISLIWKPPFWNFISCIIYRDFGTFCSKCDQGFFHGIMQAYPDKKNPSMWSMIQTKPMFWIEDCSRSKLGR